MKKFHKMFRLLLALLFGASLGIAEVGLRKSVGGGAGELTEGFTVPTGATVTLVGNLSANGATVSPTELGRIASITAYGQSLISGADAAAVRATLDAVSATASRELPSMWVWDTGDFVYARTQYDSTYDLLIKWVKVGGVNLNVQLDTVGLVARLSQPGGTPVPTITFASSLDDSTGYLTYANGRLGGAHGYEIAVITKTSHGLTSADIGKRFQDSAGEQYAITGIIDADRFYMVQKPKSFGAADPQGTGFYPTAATTLTGLDGLSDLTGWTVASAQAVVGTRLRSVYDRVVGFYVDGRELHAGEITQAKELRISEYHRVPNVRAAFDYFVATGASATWGDAALGSIWTRRILYTVHPWGQITFDNTARLGSTIVNMRFTEISPLQYARQAYSGANYLHQWLPGVAAKVMTGATINGAVAPTLDFSAPQYLDTWTGSTVSWATADSALPAGALPDFQIQLFSASTSNPWAYAMSHFAAIDPTFLDGVPSTFSARTDTFFKLGSILKSYPCGLNYATGFAASNTIGLRGFRRWAPTAAGTISEEAAWWTYVRTESAWLIYAAWTDLPAGGSITITLPGWLHGRPASAVRLFRGDTVSATTASGQLAVHATSANGHAIIRLD